MQETVEAGGIYKDPANISPEAQLIYDAELESQATRRGVLWRTLVLLRTDVALLPKPLVFTLGTASFATGFLIGTQIRRWMKIGVEPPSQPVAGGGTYELEWVQEGRRRESLSIPTPRSAYYLVYNRVYRAWHTQGTGPSSCWPTYAIAPIPPKFEPVGTRVLGDCWPPCWESLEPRCTGSEWYIDEADLTQETPVQPYTGQPYEVEIPGSPSPPAGVGDGVEDWWDEPGNEDGRCWFEWKLGVLDDACPAGGREDPYEYATAPHCLGWTYADCAKAYRAAGFTDVESYTVSDEYENTAYRPRAVVANELAGTKAHTKRPVRIGLNPRDRCDVSDPQDAYVSGQGEDQYEPFPSYATGSAAEGSYATPTHPGESTTTLRWGTTAFDPEARNWDGFGYRHIAAKHGWTAADETATRAALATTPVPIPDRGHDRWEFTGPDYGGRAGAVCRRVVVVDYDRAPSAPAPEGIITSYGKLVG